MLPLRIIDQEFNLLGEIDKYSSLQMTQSAYGIGLCELRINRYMQHANELQIDNIIFPTNQTHKAFIIKHREIELDENGKATENWVIKAYQLKTIVMQRLILPTSTLADNAIIGDAETVLKHYINTEMVNPIDTERIYPNLIIATNQNRGIEFNATARFDVLGDKLSEIALLTNMAWDITLDLDNQKFVFDVYEGMNRTADNTFDIPPVIFSTDYETLKSMSYSESKVDFKNVAIVGGEGEGAERTIEIVGAEIGRNRYEVFISASKEEIPLIEQGQNALAERAQEVFCEGQVLSKSIFEYEQDYFLNDVVTLQNLQWGITMNARITEAKEIHEPGKHNEIELTFDNNRPTLVSKIKSEIKQLKTQLLR